METCHDAWKTWCVYKVMQNETKCWEVIISCVSLFYPPAAVLLPFSSPCSFQQGTTTYHETIAYFGLEETFKGPTSCNEQGHHQLGLFDQSPVQYNTEYFQGWVTYNLSEQPVPVLQHPYCKKFFLIYSLNLFCSSLKPFFPVLPLQKLLQNLPLYFF